MESQFGRIEMKGSNICWHTVISVWIVDATNSVPKYAQAKLKKKINKYNKTHQKEILWFPQHWNCNKDFHDGINRTRKSKSRACESHYSAWLNPVKVKSHNIFLYYRWADECQRGWGASGTEELCSEQKELMSIQKIRAVAPCFYFIHPSQQHHAHLWHL